MKKFIYILCLVFFPYYVFAANYYISTTGSDLNVGSEAAPWATFNYAVGVMGPGDTLIVKDGTYNQGLYTFTDGEESRPKSIIADAGASPIIVGTVTFGSYSTTADYWVLKGLTLEDILTIRGNYFDIQDMTFRNVSRIRISYGCDSEPPSSNILIKNCTFTLITTENWIVIDSGYCTTNITVEDCTFINTTCDLMRPFGDGHIFRNNEIYGMDETGVHVDWFQVYHYGGRSTNFLIENNYIHDSSGSIGMIQNNEGANPIHSWTWRNNLIVRVDGVAQITPPYFEFYNNTFIDSGHNTEGPILLRGYSPIGEYNWAHDTIIKNNIFIGGGAYPDGPSTGWYGFSDGIETQPGLNFDADYNYVTTSKANGYLPKGDFTGTETNGISGGDPLFVDYDNNNFRPQQASPAVDSGVVIPSFNTDIEGNLRTPPWDRGAYEYGASIPPVTSIQLYQYGGKLSTYNGQLIGEPK